MPAPQRTPEPQPALEQNALPAAQIASPPAPKRRKLRNDGRPMSRRSAAKAARRAVAEPTTPTTAKKSRAERAADRATEQHPFLAPETASDEEKMAAFDRGQAWAKALPADADTKNFDAAQTFHFWLAHGK